MVVPTTTRSTNVGARVVLALLGAAGLMVAAFLNWTDDIRGLDLSWQALYRTEFVTADNIYKTVGGLSILLGLLLVVSLSSWFGSFTRLIGGLGIVMFALFAIELYRDGQSHDVQLGAWMALVASVLAVIGGFVGAGTRTVVAPSMDDHVT
jgi:hypothetical protein